MNEKEREDAFLEKIRSTLEEGSKGLDANTLSRLGAARGRALSELPARAPRWIARGGRRAWFRLSAAGFAAASAAILAVFIFSGAPPPRTPHGFPTTSKMLRCLPPASSSTSSRLRCLPPASSWSFLMSWTFTRGWLRTKTMPGKVMAVGLVLFLAVGASRSFGDDRQPPAQPSAPAPDEKELPSLELLEFLGDWEARDGQWVDPTELDELMQPVQEEVDDEST